MRYQRILVTALVTVLVWLPGVAAVKAAERQDAQKPAKARKASTKAPVAAASKPAVRSVVKKGPPAVAKASAAPVAARFAASESHDDDPISRFDIHRAPSLASAAVMVTDQNTGEVLLEKNAESVTPIASITKLMTAMVVLDGNQSMTEAVRVTEEDIDTLKGSSSRLPVGTELSREEMLRLALMASENRAASSLAHSYPGGMPAFVAAMNRKAHEIGLSDTRFEDPTGLNSSNVSSARDLTKLVAAASRYPLIREYSTTAEHEVAVSGRMRRFANTNALVRNGQWEIGVSKTGYISEAGRCLVMQAWLHEKPLIIVLLDSFGKYTRIADAERIRKWLVTAGYQRVAVLGSGPG